MVRYGALLYQFNRFFFRINLLRLNSKFLGSKDLCFVINLPLSKNKAEFWKKTAQYCYLLLTQNFIYLKLYDELNFYIIQVKQNNFKFSIRSLM